jgi:hypothetical protein
VALVAGLIVLPAAGALAIGSVDQMSLGTNSPGTMAVDATRDAAQTLTSSRTGVLRTVDLAIGKSATTADLDELVVEIRPTNGAGVPLEDDLQVLASFTVFGSELPTTPSVTMLYNINFSSDLVAVTPGTELAIVLRSNVGASDSFLWAVDLVDSYAGGGAFSRATTWQAESGDAGFRSFVPEPSGGAVAALLTLLALRRRSRSRA